MINDIEFDDKEEFVYDLNSIGLKGELIVTPGEVSYIITEDDYFSLDNIIEEKEGVIIKNENNSLKIEKEKFYLIKDIV